MVQLLYSLIFHYGLFLILLYGAMVTDMRRLFLDVLSWIFWSHRNHLVRRTFKKFSFLRFFDCNIKEVQNSLENLFLSNLWKSRLLLLFTRNVKSVKMKNIFLFIFNDSLWFMKGIKNGKMKEIFHSWIIFWCNYGI